MHQIVTIDMLADVNVSYTLTPTSTLIYPQFFE